MPLPFDPNWRPPVDPVETGTDLASLMSVPDPDLARVERDPKHQATDFVSLKRDGFMAPKAPVPPRTWTDLLIDALTPTLIFVMVYAVVFFLLDVRYIFTSVHDANLRFVALFFIIGVVALNRLIARDGQAESILYFLGLALVMFLYTLATTSQYDVGSVARGFMDDPWVATGFNTMVVITLWWVVNRLVHECCVDENLVAGDVGMLTGVARRLEAGWRKRAEVPVPAEKPKPPKRPKLLFETMDLEPFDPLEGYQPKASPVLEQGGSLADRLPRRHPGMSIFVFSVPVMAIFSVGIAVVRNAGPAWVQAGEFYMGVYTVCALALLMLTSLGGLRQYFRSRRVTMPDNIGWFWIGLGIVMIAMVLIAATRLPKPDLPPPVYIDHHEMDPWARGGDYLELEPVSAAPIAVLEQSQFMDRLGVGVLAVFAVLFVYGVLRGILVAADTLILQPGRYPAWLIWLATRAARLVRLLLHAPRIRLPQRRLRIQRDIATSAAFLNSLGDATRAPQMSVADHLEHAYSALCALAYDLGVPRKIGQTPYEFMNAFPHELNTLRDDAEEITRLFVLSAYSPMELDDKVLDRVRKFWITYERVRRRILR